MKLLLNTFKNLPDLPKLHFGTVKVTERPGKHREWWTLMSMVCDSGSSEISAYWLELLRAVDEGHDLHLGADLQEK